MLDGDLAFRRSARGGLVNYIERHFLQIGSSLADRSSLGIGMGATLLHRVSPLFPQSTQSMAHYSLTPQDPDFEVVELPGVGSPRIGFETIRVIGFEVEGLIVRAAKRLALELANA